jgi:glycerophosphoryl diester phosphodiesterase
VNNVIIADSPPNHRFFARFASQPLIIAHRGYRSWYPENTFSAFTACLGRCRMIELDVRLSRDGTAVVFHDRRLTRTSNAAMMARDLRLTDLDLDEWRSDQLRRLDAGSWFVETDPFGTLRGSKVHRDRLVTLPPQRIPILQEVLAWAAVHCMPLNIDIKDMGATRLESQVVGEVIRLVRAAGMSGMVVLSSFNHDYLRACRHHAPEIATAALQQRFHPTDLVPYLHSLGVCAYHPEHIITDQALVHTLRAAGMAVNVFTVNDPVHQRRLLGWGVTGIFTDFPEQKEVTSRGAEFQEAGEGLVKSGSRCQYKAARMGRYTGR